MFTRAFSLLPLVALLLSAQTQDAKARMGQLTSLPVSNVSPDYRLGPGDLLEIRVLGVEDLTQVARISPGGLVTLPMIGPVVAGGLTNLELQAQIAGTLKDRNLVRDPQVTVFTKEYRSQPIYVLGAVNQPGQYMATGQLRLLDALSLAGGLDMKKAAGYLLIQRGRESAGRAGEPAALGSRPSLENSGRIRVDLAALLDEGDLSLNVVLHAGDVIQAPEKEAEQFYVVGDVQRPGVFAFGPQKNVSVLTAMSFAGGVTRTAKPEKARILREVSGQAARKHIEVDLKKVMEGKGEDIALRPDDVLLIPTSGRKSFQAYFLPAAVAAGIGSLVWAGFTR